MALQDCVVLVQKAINLLESSSCWDDQAALRAHVLGLQGKKRVERYESRKEHMMVQCYIHDMFDLFDVEMQPEIGEIILPPMPDITSFFEAYIKKLWAVYHELHEIANALVIAGYKPLSESLYCYIECLHKCIIDNKRELREYLLANKEYHHISRYEVSYYNIHDKYEKKEESQGYK